MENKKFRLANYSLFDDDLIGQITTPEEELEIYLSQYTVSLYYYNKQFYVYKIEPGKNCVAKRFDDFNEALSCAREEFHKFDESYDAPYRVENDSLNNQGMINYLRQYDLTKKIVFAPSSDSVGLYFEGGKYNVYQTDERPHNAYYEVFESFDDALTNARKWLKDLRHTYEMAMGPQYYKKPENK